MVKLHYTNRKATFDPRELGARCDECPLKGSAPVPPRPVSNPKLILIGEGPGATEEAEGEPFVGQSGQYLDRTLEVVGVPKASLHITNSTLCRPKVALSPADWKKALACCAPRLEAELVQLPTRSALALGGKAQQALTGRAKIFDWMLSPYPGIAAFSGFTVISALHPAFCAREPAWFPALAIGLDRAWKLAAGRLAPWKWPRIVYEKCESALEEILEADWIGLDVETASIEVDSDLLNVGVASEKLGVSVQWQHASSKEKRLVREILRRKRIKKVQHNGQFDVRVLRCNDLDVAGYEADTMHSATIIAGRLRRSLSLVAALEFHAPRWKSEFRITTDKAGAARFQKADPIERAVYNTKDAWMTLLIWFSHREKLKQENNGEAQFERFMELNDVGIRMSIKGVKTEPKNFKTHRIRLRRKRADARRDLIDLTKVTFRTKKRLDDLFGEEGFKPGSSNHIRLLFEAGFGIVPRAWSKKTGLSRYDDKVLSDLCIYSGDVSRAARLLRIYRKSNKLLETYVLGLTIGKDGRVHPNWNCSGAQTNRWASSDPNLQNIFKPVFKKLKNGKKVLEFAGLRDLYCASEGKVLNERDYQRLEAWIIAYLSNDLELIRMLTEADLHTETAKLFFQTSDVTKQMRDMAKILRYAWQYLARPETAWKQAVPEFPDLSLTLVERIFARLDAAHPMVKRWHRKQVKQAETQDFVEAPLSGRRFYFHGVPEPNIAVNFPVQTTGSDLLNPALLRVVARLDPDEDILIQAHDAIIGESPRPGDLDRKMREEMERPIILEGIERIFRTDRKVGVNWGTMEEVHG